MAFDLLFPARHTRGDLSCDVWRLWVSELVPQCGDRTRRRCIRRHCTLPRASRTKQHLHSLWVVHCSVCHVWVSNGVDETLTKPVYDILSVIASTYFRAADPRGAQTIYNSFQRQHNNAVRILGCGSGWPVFSPVRHCLRKDVRLWTQRRTFSRPTT